MPPSKAEIKQEEQELFLFERTFSLLRVNDACSSAQQYLRSSNDPEKATRRKQAKYDGDCVPKTGESGFHGRNLVHVAAANGRYETLEELLSVGHRSAAHCLNVRDTHGDTPVIMASRGGHLECLRILLMAGADPNIQCLGSQHTGENQNAVVK